MKVHHIGYIVKNIEKAGRDFRSLGYAQTTPVTFDPIRNADISFWENNSYRVEIVCPRDESSVVYDLMKNHKNMPYHICYCTPCLEDSIAELLRQGYFQIDEPTEAPAIDGKRVCFLMSGQSGMIELLEETP